MFSSGLSRVEGERGHREVPVHAVRGGQHPDGVAQLDALDAPVHHVEVDGLARQAEVLVLDVGQVLLAFGLEVRRYRHVVEVHGLRDDPEVPDSRSRLEVDLVRVDRLDGGVLLQRLDAALLEPRAERDDPGGDLGGVHVLGVVEQVLPELDHLRVRVAVVLDVVEVAVAAGVPDSDVPAEPVHQLVHDACERLLPVGVAVEAVVGVRHGHLTDRELLRVDRLRVVDVHEVGQELPHGVVVELLRLLDGVHQLRELSLADDGLHVLEVPVDGEAPPVEDAASVLPDLDHGGHLLDLVVRRVGDGQVELEGARPVVRKLQLRVQQRELHISRGVDQLAVQIDLVCHRLPPLTSTDAVYLP